MERFLHRGRDGQVMDVDEFQIAKSLLAGETGLLSQKVGAKHLFEWCLEYGKQSTALAMLSHGVPGCVVKLCNITLPPLPPAVNGGPHPEDQGVPMRDRDADIRTAKRTAEREAEMPLVRALLEACRSEKTLPAEVTAEAMARLLDIAILLRDTEPAACCASRCTRFPLRWKFVDFVVRCGWGIDIQETEILKAALAAGVGLKHLRDDCTQLSLPEAVVLSEDAELWHQVRDLLQLGPWPTAAPRNNKAKYLLTEAADGDLCLSFERLLRAKRAGLTLGTFRQRSVMGCTACPGPGPATHMYLSLLDLAILFRQRDCAALCGSMDVCSTEWTPGLSLEDSWACEVCGSSDVVLGLSLSDACFWRIARLAPGRKAAAGEALRAALRASRGRAREMAGLGVLQALRWWARGKLFSPALVNVVLTFSAERPSLARALEGRWAELLQSPWWEEPGQQAAQVESQQSQKVMYIAERDDRNEQDPECPGQAAAQESAPEAHSEAPASKLEGADSAGTNDLLTALRNSRSDMRPLSPEGVVVFRLTRQANAPRVNDLLFDMTGPLKKLHQRVLEAGCEVPPLSL